LKGRENGRQDLEHFVGTYGLFGRIGTGAGQVGFGGD
jgi:hypothetical protein